MTVMVPCCVVVEVTHTVVVESSALTKLAVPQYWTLCLPRRCMVQVLGNEHCRCELASGSHCCCGFSSRAYTLRLNFCLQKEDRGKIDAFNSVCVDASCSRDDEHSRSRYCCRYLNGVLGCTCRRDENYLPNFLIPYALHFPIMQVCADFHFHIRRCFTCCE